MPEHYLMKVMNCPLNGPRNISEFSCGGEIESMPDPRASTGTEWSAYLFMSDNPAGLVKEWWLHTATAYWFIAERNTVTDEIVATYPAAQLFDERVEFTDQDHKQ